MVFLIGKLSLHGKIFKWRLIKGIGDDWSLNVTFWSCLLVICLWWGVRKRWQIAQKKIQNKFTFHFKGIDSAQQWRKGSMKPKVIVELPTEWDLPFGKNFQTREQVLYVICCNKSSQSKIYSTITNHKTTLSPLKNLYDLKKNLKRKKITVLKYKKNNNNNRYIF